MTNLKIKKHTSTILTGVSILGVAATTVSGIYATPKVISILDSERTEKQRALSKMETINAVWSVCVPTILLGTATMFCILGINTFNKRQQSVVSSAYAMLNESYKKYKKAVEEVYGDGADLKIRQQMARKRYISSDGDSVYDPDFDNSEQILFYDELSTTYFKSTMASVLNALYHFSRNLNLRGYVSLNEYYYFLGLDSVKHGDDTGWSLNELRDGGVMWLDFNTSRITMDDLTDCYICGPVYNPELLDFDNI